MLVGESQMWIFGGNNGRDLGQRLCGVQAFRVQALAEHVQTTVCGGGFSGSGVRVPRFGRGNHDSRDWGAV